MFRITFLTDDKRLARAHKALVGVCIGRPEVDVITDVVVENGEAGRAPDIDLEAFFKPFPEQFMTSEVTAALKAQNRSHYSGYVAAVLNRGITARVIRRKSVGRYVKVKPR